MALIGSEWCRSRAQVYFAQTQRYEDVYYLPPNDYLIVGSLGYRAALADLIWMKALVYYGEELGQRGDVKHLYQYGDAMIALDPDFKRAYRWVASCALYRTGTVTVDDARAAIGYLEVAARRFPDDGELAWDLGANYTYELAPMLPIGAARDAVRSKGLEYLEAAVARNAGPEWLVLQTSSAQAALGRSEQAIRHLEDVYATATDPGIKLSIEHKLGQLRNASYAEALRHSHEAFQAAHKRDFPYLSPTLYVLVGARPAFGGDAWLAQGFDPAAARLAAHDVSN
ncbi:MAG: hypothetical protein RL701_4926 [Pseudomonadota bacterium]|jgi:hypothetical protein